MFNIKFKNIFIGLSIVIFLGACGDSNATDSEVNGANNANSSAVLPESVKGKVVTMEFNYASNGAPYSNGDKVLFTFSSGGSLMLSEQYTVVSENVELVETEYVWTDSINALKYALSLLNNEIHEVNLNTVSGTFLGQFTLFEDANITVPEANTTLPETNTAGELRLWKRTDVSNKSTVVTTTKGLWASSFSIWSEAEMKKLTDILYPHPDAKDKLVTTLVSSSADEVVYKVTCDNTCVYYNLEATYTYSVMDSSEVETYSANKPTHSATTPQELINLNGHYSVEDTAVPEVFGNILAGHMSLDLTIGVDGSIHYIVKDKDDNSILFENSISWDGEKDELLQNGNQIWLEKFAGNNASIIISRVSDWFEFHLYVPIYYPGVGNGTTDVQWNVPYSSN